MTKYAMVQLRVEDLTCSYWGWHIRSKFMHLVQVQLTVEGDVCRTGCARTEDQVKCVSRN